MINRYYEILGVTEKSSLSEVKKSFRIKARLLHPDVNKSENAHADFILLIEAYECLINKLTGKVMFGKSAKTERYETYERWQDNEAERARRRAEFYANRGSAEFEESEYFKAVDSVLSTIASHLPLLGGICLYIVLPIVLVIFQGKIGLIMTLFIWFITIPFAGVLKREFVFKPKELAKAIVAVIRSRLFTSIIITIINLYVILKIGFQTLIPLSLLFGVYLISVTITFLILKFILSKSRRYYLNTSLCLAPLVISILLAMNYYISFNPKHETYMFKHQLRKFVTRFEGINKKTTMINLENDKYKDFKGIRMFLIFSQMEHAFNIRYTFREGLFGIRVMTEYKFNRGG